MGRQQVQHLPPVDPGLTTLPPLTGRDPSENKSFEDLVLGVWVQLNVALLRTVVLSAAQATPPPRDDIQQVPPLFA